MPQPPRYVREKNFTLDLGNKTDHSALNAEFDSAANSINDIRTNLAILQADDGKLRPSVVTSDSISSELRVSLVEGVIIDAQDMLNRSQAAAASAEAAEIAAETAAASASSSAASAQSSATTASAAATTATGAASTATSAATSANADKTAAAASQTAAASSASSAQASATSAQSSATTASNAATTATTKAGEAATSASTAVTKAAEASASAATATTKANEASASASQAAASAAAINPANLVHMTGDEEIAGVKTFSSSPVVPTAVTSDNSAKAASTAFVAAAVSAGFPSGFVAHFAMSSAPTGWLKANGAAVSRTAYGALFAAIGTTFGAGDGSTTFNLPDLRGEFIRGWDDSRGIDSGRAFGSAQGDAIRNITGYFQSGLMGNNFTNLTGAFTSSHWAGTGLSGGTGGWYSGVNFDASKSVPTAGENRPRNIALLACIKY